MTELFTSGEPIADTKAPAGPISEQWDTRRFEARLVNPANRRKLSVIRSEEHTSELQSRGHLVRRLLPWPLPLSPYTTLFRSTVGFLVPPVSVLFGWVA